MQKYTGCMLTQLIDKKYMCMVRFFFSTFTFVQITYLVKKNIKKITSVYKKHKTFPDNNSFCFHLKVHNRPSNKQERTKNEHQSK